MDPLLDVVTEFVSRVTSMKAEAIAKSFRRLDPAVGDPDIENLVAGSGLREIATKLVDLWRESKLPGDVVSGMILGASAASGKNEGVGALELVWTDRKLHTFPREGPSKCCSSLSEGRRIIFP